LFPEEIKEKRAVGDDSASTRSRQVVWCKAWGGELQSQFHQHLREHKSLAFKEGIV
jgi:hypothetical protein